MNSHSLEVGGGCATRRMYRKNKDSSFIFLNNLTGYMRWDNPGVHAIREILQNFS